MIRKVLFVVSVLLISACSPTPIVENKQATPASTTEGYPAPAQNNLIEEGYPSPTEANSFPATIDVPAPDENTGVATGYLKIKGSETPYLGALILGELDFADDPSAPPLISYSVESSIHGEVDQTGRFVFRNIPPGEYGIVLWTPASAALLMNPDTQVYVNLKVEAGQVTDLGTLYVE